jgi:hypothetical protein
MSRRITTLPKRSICLQVKVTPEQSEAVFQAATRARVTVSAFIRELVTEHLEEATREVRSPARQQVEA